MISKRLLVFFILTVSTLHAAEKEMVTLIDLKDGISGFRYLWEVPRATLNRLPKWSPTETESPLSPHKAAKIASTEVKRHFPESTKLKPTSISLHQHWQAKEAEAVWVYHVSFEANPEPTGKQKSLLEVLVLLDGAIVPPIVTPLNDPRFRPR